MEETPQKESMAFNMGIATLQRIDVLLQKVAGYFICHNFIMVERCVFELFKELYVFLSKEEKEKGLLLYNDIRECQLKSKGRSVSYRKEVLSKLSDFDFWIRVKLFEKGLLMAKAEDTNMVIGKFV